MPPTQKHIPVSCTLLSVLEIMPTISNILCKNSGHIFNHLYNWSYSNTKQCTRARIIHTVHSRFSGNTRNHTIHFYWWQGHPILLLRSQKRSFNVTISFITNWSMAKYIEINSDCRWMQAHCIHIKKRNPSSYPVLKVVSVS